MKYTICIIIFVFSLSTLPISCYKKVTLTKDHSKEIQGVDRSKDSILNIDYINLEYQFLDKDFIIDTKALKIANDSILNEKLKFARNRSDSIAFILNFNLKNDFSTHIALNRILYKWEKLSFYIWLSESESKEIASKFGFNHPYGFLQYLKNEQNDVKKVLFFKELITRVKRVDSTFPHNSVANEDILKESFKINPARITKLENSKHH